MQNTTTTLAVKAIMICFISLIISSKAMAGGGPYLVINGYDTVYVNQGNNYTDSGATAHDSSGAIISGASISTTQTPKFNKLIPGTFKFIYNYTDALGKKATPVTRVIIVNKDKVPPVIVLNGSTNMTILVGSTFKDPGVASAYDQLDGDVSGTLVVSNPVNTSIKGDYTIAYSDSDASGNKDTARRYVHVVTTTYTISGTISVSGTSSTNRYAKVYLIKYDSTDSSLTAIMVQKLSGVNTFSFSSLTPDNYLVKAALDSADTLRSSFLPTYYGGVTTWSSATNINLTANTSITIHMVSGTNAGGPGFIAGKVSQGANKVGDPYPGLPIILNDKAGKAVAYTYSDAQGNFSFKNLAVGDYSLFGEIAGKKIISGIVKITIQNIQQTQINIAVNSTSIVTTVVNNTSSIGNTIKSASNTIVYPNPANNKLIINSSNQNAVREIQLYNTSGQLVLTNIYSGAFEAEVNIEKLSTGIYFLKVNYSSGVSERMNISIIH